MGLKDYMDAHGIGNEILQGSFEDEPKPAIAKQRGLSPQVDLRPCIPGPIAAEAGGSTRIKDRKGGPFHRSQRLQLPQCVPHFCVSQIYILPKLQIYSRYLPIIYRHRCQLLSFLTSF